ncbi:GntR family transcriptional regulator [Roseibium sp.]|uniref:GntR family transcriptional regulator n=1 Tax=Roseibium sp. TaxID=1936156 RepID=UPI003D0BDEFC
MADGVWDWRGSLPETSVMGADLVFDIGATDPQVAAFQGERRRRKADAVYVDMKRQILLGDLTPTSPITEQSLAQTYNCSQSTIREALLTLQEDGLVIRRGYQGTFVTQTTNDEAIILFRLRLNIETAAVDRITPNITQEQLDTLREIAQQYDSIRAKRDKIGISEADIAFHMTMLRFADMPVLEPVLLRTLLHLHRFIITRHTRNLVWIDKITASHHDLIDAIATKDPDRARKMTIQHATTNTIEVTEEVRMEVFAKI